MIERNPRTASRPDYDLVIVGGGVQGVALSLEAARRGLRPILLERGDFGGETSWNSLRIIHGPSSRETSRAGSVANAVRKVMYWNTLKATNWS